MSYLGENKFFSFRDGYCEALPNISVNTSEAAEFGRTVARFFRRFSVACDSFSHNHILYAICCGLSECGRDVYVCENTDLPSFKFGFPLLSADCGIYVSGNGSLKISLFADTGFPINSDLLTGIMNGSPAEPVGKCGKITSATSFKSIYINNIFDSLGSGFSVIPAGVSCGNRSVRSVWHEFFTGEDDTLVFQVSDDGQRVNAYSVKAGFISHEKLMLTYAAQLSASGQTVYIPENFHYAADYMNEGSALKLKRFSPDGEIPKEAIKQRFLCDPLFMCTHLAADRSNFFKTVKSLPQLAAARREVTVHDVGKIPCGKAIPENGGRVYITKSGKNRVSLLAQAYSAEAAAELCSEWTEKLRRIGSCGIS